MGYHSFIQPTRSKAYNQPNNPSNNSPAGTYKIAGPQESYYRFAGREMGETGNNGHCRGLLRVILIPRIKI